MTRSHLLAAALGVLLGVVLSLFVVAGAASRSAVQQGVALSRSESRSESGQQSGAPLDSGLGATPSDRSALAVKPLPSTVASPPGEWWAGGAPQPTATVDGPPAPSAISVLSATTHRPQIGVASWQRDPEISFFGPGLYGQRTACGLALTTRLIGAAHRSLPCGTLVEFRWRDRTLTVPVVDRGPYVAGRTWDLTGGACVALRHCFTGKIEWRTP